jgi:hypothetical protein
MKKVTKIVAYSVVLICCCVGASVIATNLVNKKNNKVVYVSIFHTPVRISGCFR